MADPKVRRLFGKEIRAIIENADIAGSFLLRQEPGPALRKTAEDDSFFGDRRIQDRGPLLLTQGQLSRLRAAASSAQTYSGEARECVSTPGLGFRVWYQAGALISRFATNS